MEGRYGGCCIMSGQTGGLAVRKIHVGADGQILLICHDSQFITHQAVGYTSVCILSDSTGDRQTAQSHYGATEMNAKSSLSNNFVTVHYV